MAKFNIGDLVVLKSGSMRMCVEDIGEDEIVHTVWCNEGAIGRDRFDAALLNKWEHREDAARAGGGERGGDRGGDRPGRGKPYGGDREGGGKPHRGGGDARTATVKRAGTASRARKNSTARKTSAGFAAGVPSPCGGGARVGVPGGENRGERACPASTIASRR